MDWDDDAPNAAVTVPKSEAEVEALLIWVSDPEPDTTELRANVEPPAEDDVAALVESSVRLVQGALSEGMRSKSPWAKKSPWN